MPNPRCKTSSHPYLKSLCNNYYKQGPSNADPQPAKPTQATAQGPKHSKATAGSYELNQRYPTPSNSAESSKQHKTGSEHLPQQARTVMLTDYTREMSSRTSPASRKRPKAISKRSVSVRGVQRYHSYINRSCLPSAIEEDKIILRIISLFVRSTNINGRFIDSERSLSELRISSDFFLKRAWLQCSNLLNLPVSVVFWDAPLFSMRLTSMDDVPKDLIYDVRSVFSASAETVKTSCKKKEMKVEFRLLNDILAKSVTVKAGSFDTVTHERFY
ncbi:hypothetical protein F511_43318 [Dorcoceras hygrometricum]|uniref:Uncharacterized protein n=1 Tax=Dorcoceras hygrometricum TaxID=472368 RepID=A0A2Z7BL60_9LAMI|nr:hypothetical protein F511_43318 [Dorcoceras hygrometricum]